jgi:hypothetical protein
MIGQEKRRAGPFARELAGAGLPGCRAAGLLG